MIVSDIRFKGIGGERGYSRQPSSRMEMGMEVMEVFFDSMRFRVALPVSSIMMFTDYSRIPETRHEFGSRLSYAADDVAKQVKHDIANKLRSMGHMV